jgi:hypothetical protein
MKRNNPGRRERLAGKRHRRAIVWSNAWPSGSAPLKVGSRHFGRCMRERLSVAENENLG